MALTGVLSAGVVSLIFVKLMNLKLGYALGLFAGSGTSTPTLQAAIATLATTIPLSAIRLRIPSAWLGPFCSSTSPTWC
jgi:putative transport protein